MANETQHTPTPWDIHTSFDNLEIHPLSDEDGLTTIADIPTDSGFTKEVREANAQLIVKAVNSHAKLLDACALGLRELRGFYNDNESEAIRILKAAIEAAK